jgi:hypothetical protein
MKRITRLNERDLSRIVRRVINEGEGFKSNKKEDRELEFSKKLDDIFFREDYGNLFSDSGEYGYLSSQHTLKGKLSPRQRKERIEQVIELLKNYIQELEQTKFSVDSDFRYNQDDYKSVWGRIEGEEEDYDEENN